MGCSHSTSRDGEECSPTPSSVSSNPFSQPVTVLPLSAIAPTPCGPPATPPHNRSPLSQQHSRLPATLRRSRGTHPKPQASPGVGSPSWVDSQGTVHHSLSGYDWVPVSYFGGSEDAKRRAVENHRLASISLSTSQHH